MNVIELIIYDHIIASRMSNQFQRERVILKKKNKKHLTSIFLFTESHKALFIESLHKLDRTFYVYIL